MTIREHAEATDKLLGIEPRPIPQSEYKTRHFCHQCTYKDGDVCHIAMCQLRLECMHELGHLVVDLYGNRNKCNTCEYAWVCKHTYDKYIEFVGADE